MKYYIYISDAKVDMLFPQVPHEIKQKVAVEFKMDLKLLSASRKTETESEDNRVARLETVVDFIREFGNVGSVDAPDEYIADTLPMRWGPIDGWVKSPVIYFGGQTDTTVVGLGGSMRHVLGNPGTEAPGSGSLTPALLDVLYKELGMGKNQFKGARVTADRNENTSLRAVQAASGNMFGSAQKLEFLAKRLLHGPLQTTFMQNPKVEVALKWTLLATPLYVALAD